MTFDLVLSVSKTVYPDGKVKYHNGMLKIERSTKGYNEWFASLHRIDPILPQKTINAMNTIAQEKFELAMVLARLKEIQRRLGYA